MRRRLGFALIVAVVYVGVGQTASRAETGAEAWLRYAALPPDVAKTYASLPGAAFVTSQSPVLRSAQRELGLGIHGMLGRTVRIVDPSFREGAIIIGTIGEVRKLDPAIDVGVRLRPDGFLLTWRRVRGFKCLIVAGANERGAMYGVFALLSRIAQGRPIDIAEVQQSSATVRWVNQWDNLDGTIERGYGGPSIFYDRGMVRADLSRASSYARLLASIGINGCVVNNVNAEPRMLDSTFFRELARIAEVFRPWGVRLGLAIDLSAPKVVGGLDTFDPADARVAKWWSDKFDELYRAIPDFGGVVIKADSEGRLGPSVYHRTPADAANVIAQALKPHGGIVFYRAFVYDHHLDWTNLKNDRAKAAYDNFHGLDGKFDDNVIIQIKNGPIDFQVREPASPLFGGLERTNQAAELQITQEYTGQQHHTVFLVPMWKQVLDFDMRVRGRPTPVKDLVAGRSFSRPLGGYVGVLNVGMDENWLGNDLALANLYGFGRIAWNPDLSSKDIIDEWTRLTFGNAPEVVRTIADIQLNSWTAYESYTGVLGLQTLTNITGSHYGPAPASQERNGWGQWIRAERDGVGMDRSVATGTGFVGQYAPEARKQYETADATPDELLLFFHHVPYTYKLHSGKTVIQTIYDAHYDGAERVADFLRKWQSLQGQLDDARYREVRRQLEYQAGHAIVWRDAINDWFHRISGIADEKGRVGNHPGRIEAEAMQLDGYKSVNITPWEGASGGEAVQCVEPLRSCSARSRFAKPAGRYAIDVQYFDQINGASKFRVFVGDTLIDEWTADMRLPATAPNADSSTRRWGVGVTLRPGEEIRIQGIPDAGEGAALDYVELRRLDGKSSSND